MSKLNKTQIYAIRWLASQATSPEIIASELEINIEQVNKTMEKYGSSTTNEDNVQVKKSSTKISNMITETSGKKTNSVAIMTKEASERHDAMRNKTQTKHNNEKTIFRPKNNG